MHWDSRRNELVKNENSFGYNHVKRYESIYNEWETFDIRLEQNFKLFVSGPSRCGKTVFISKLIENIQRFSKQPPRSIIYVYKVWQDKYEEMQSLGINFMEDNEKAVENIKSTARGQPILVIFDDLIGSKSLPEIANMFTVDARHLNISMVFLSQRMFVNDEYFKQISQNCDYFCLFKNPQNSSEIRTLAQPNVKENMVLVDIYPDATERPFTYLFINLTEECNAEVKYSSNLFDGTKYVYVNVGRSFKKMVAHGTFNSIRLSQESMKKNIRLKSFNPSMSQMMYENNVFPSQQSQSQNVYLQPMQTTNENSLSCQEEENDLYTE